MFDWTIHELQSNRPIVSTHLHTESIRDGDQAEMLGAGCWAGTESLLLIPGMYPVDDSRAAVFQNVKRGVV